jgi:hypothetical protein
MITKSCRRCVISDLEYMIITKLGSSLRIDCNSNFKHGGGIGMACRV